jgi:hypothetical protein
MHLVIILMSAILTIYTLTFLTRIREGEDLNSNANLRGLRREGTKDISLNTKVSYD